MLFERNVVVAAALCAVATPAYADEYFAVTPSSATEAHFGESPAAVVGKLSSHCIDRSWTVTSSTQSEVVCEAPLNMGQSIVGQLLLGNSYSTPPRRFFRFNVANIGDISRVQASGWMELQMAFGQTKRNDFSGPEFHNGAMMFMIGAGGKYPVGTTFPNHAALGFDQGKAVQNGKFFGFPVVRVWPQSAAEKAGIQSGDILLAVAGKRFKNFDDYLDATAKAAKKERYEVELAREGRPLKLTVDRYFRPTWSEAVVPSPRVAEAAVQSAGAISVADELSKLLTLKESGVLTEAEFESEKKKLLKR